MPSWRPPGEGLGLGFLGKGEVTSSKEIPCPSGPRAELMLITAWVRPSRGREEGLRQGDRNNSQPIKRPTASP